MPNLEDDGDSRSALPGIVALASLFAGQFAVPSVHANPEQGWYDTDRQLFISALTHEPAFVGPRGTLVADTTVSYCDFCRPTNRDGSDDTTYSAPDGFKTDV